MTNQQPRESSSVLTSGCLDIVEVWDTIQGEGPFAGTPAVFVRLAGCNLECPLCDTNYTEGRRVVSVSEIMLLIDIASRKTTDRLRRLVVLTGGEPFRQNIFPLIEALIAIGFKVQIETNGTMFFPTFLASATHSRLTEFVQDGRLVVVCSPKTPKANQDVVPFVRALKYVVQAGKVDTTSGLPISSLGCSYGRPAQPSCFPHVKPWDVYIQPADEQDELLNKANMLIAVESCMRFGYRLCLQMHKIVGLP